MSQKNGFPCTFCSKSFSRKNTLNKHMKAQHSSECHMCPFCIKTFICKEQLFYHIRVHTGELPHRCDYCQGTFTSKKLFTEHLKQHIGDSRDICKICTKPFTKTKDDYLIYHNSCRLYTCNECGEHFPFKRDLTLHLRVHQKCWFQCEICDKDFLCKGSLKIHYRMHMNFGGHTRRKAIDETQPLSVDSVQPHGVKVEIDPIALG